VGVPDKHPQNAEILSCMPEYARSIRIWQNRASRAIKRNVGVVNCHVTHNYHGQKSQRGYGSRWKILRDNHFNPYVDIYRDYQGLYQLTPDKPALRDGIRAYFRSRNEDGA
jgi:hypothetical protein